jgi:hypothetical protein
MTLQVIYYIILFTCAAAVIYLFSNAYIVVGNGAYGRFRRSPAERLSSLVKADEEVDSVFRESGWNISSSLYKVIWFIVVGGILLILLYQRFTTGGASLMLTVFWVCLAASSYPKANIFDLKTPFYYITSIFIMEFKNKKNKEIYRAICQLKNITMSKTDKPLGSVFIIEELMKFTECTKPIFARMLSYWIRNERKEACEYFSEAIGTREGRELADVLIKLDDLKPEELRDQLALYQATVKQERRSYREKRNELKGYLLYALVIISTLVVLLNFLIVVLFIDAIKMFNGLFI